MPGESSHAELASELLAEVEHLHARVEVLEASWKEMYESAKKKASSVVSKVKHTVAEAVRKRAITTKDITEFLQKEFGHDAVGISTAGDPERWDFTIQGRLAYVTHAKGSPVAAFNGVQYSTFEALKAEIRAANAPPPAVATAAEMRGYTASILRQQAALLEY